MPELPEVETVRQALEPALKNQQIQDVEIHHADIVMGPEGLSPHGFMDNLKGRTIHSVQRRGKRLAWKLDSGAVVEIQLRMTGRFHVQSSPQPPEFLTHIAVTFSLSRGTTLFYDDVRRLGGFYWHTASSWEELSQALGPEPLSSDFSVQEFAACFQGSRAALKNALMDQKRVAGIGNIYASEILYRAGLSPKRAARTLADKEWCRVYQSTRELLGEALRRGGTTIRDFQSLDGGTGDFQDSLQVYSRAGQNCRECGEKIVKFQQAGRSTFWCPSCQN